MFFQVARLFLPKVIVLVKWYFSSHLLAHLTGNESAISLEWFSWEFEMNYGISKLPCKQFPTVNLYLYRVKYIHRLIEPNLIVTTKIIHWSINWITVRPKHDNHVLFPAGHRKPQAIKKQKQNQCSMHLYLFSYLYKIINVQCTMYIVHCTYFL